MKLITALRSACDRILLSLRRCQNSWAAVERSVDRMGVNARLMAPEILAAVRVRHSDNAGL
jgi:hypothetical protein